MVQFSSLFVLFISKIVNETTHMQEKRHIQLNVYTAQQPINIAPDKNLRSLGKYAPFFCELGINIFNCESQYITVLFHCVFQNFQLGILVS